MKHYGGIDLHSTNNYLGILDENDKRVCKKKLPNELSEVLKALTPYKKKMEGIVVEAANFAIRDYPYVRRYYQKKMAKTNNVVAIKAVAHKIARACYYMIRNQEVFNPKRAFG